MAKDLTLKIYSVTAPTAITNSTPVLFNASQLSWANILDIWDECVSFYEGKAYEIWHSGNNTKAEDTGIVITSANGTFQYKAEKDPNTFIGNVNYNTGNPVEITTTQTTEDGKKAEIEEGIFETFIKELCSKITIKVFKKGNTAATITSATYAETIDESSNNAQYTITWDEQKKQDLKQRLTVTYSNYSYSGNTQS